MIKTVRTPKLEIAYQETGPADGPPVILLHGWPSDPHDWDGVAPPLAAGRMSRPGALAARLWPDALPRSSNAAIRSAGSARVGCARLHGCAWHPSRRCSPATTGAVAAPAWQLRCGRSACVGWSRSTATTFRTSPRPSAGAGRAGTSPLVSVVFPHRARPRRTAAEPPRYCPSAVATLVAELAVRRRHVRRYRRRASTIPDFVDVTIQSYRHRYGNAPGDPALDALEQRLAEQPSITVPTIVLHGACDGVGPPSSPKRTPDISRRAMSVA